MSFNLSEHFSKRFEPFTAQLVKITKIEADEWGDGTPLIAFTFTSTRHPGTRHVEKISCQDDKLWLFARLYNAAGIDLVGKQFVLSRIDDPKEHSKHLLNKTILCGFDLNNKGYIRVSEMVRKDESLDAWLSSHAVHRVANPSPEVEAEQNAELDAVFAPPADAREPGADDDFPL